MFMPDEFDFSVSIFTADKESVVSRCHTGDSRRGASMALAFSSTPLAPTELEDATTRPTTYDIGDLLPLSTSPRPRRPSRSWPRALLDNGLCSTSLGLDFFQPATRPAPLSLLSIGLSNLPGPTLFGLSSTRPATSLFGLSSSRPATSLFGPSSTRPATSRFGLRRTRPATSLFGLSSTRSTTSSTQPQLGASSHSAPDPACNAHSSRDAARGSRYCTLFFCLSPSTFVFFFFVYCLFLALSSFREFFFHTNPLEGEGEYCSVPPSHTTTFVLLYFPILSSSYTIQLS